MELGGPVAGAWHQNVLTSLNFGDLVHFCVVIRCPKPTPITPTLLTESSQKAIGRGMDDGAATDLCELPQFICGLCK